MHLFILAANKFIAAWRTPLDILRRLVQSHLAF
jgi:hypothetical protein